MNILLNDRTKDWYSEIGKYLVSVYNGDLPGDLSYFKDKLKNKNLPKKTIDVYGSIGSMFLTSTLDESAMLKIFGPGLYHDEFGEGFDGEYDEETDDYLEPDIKESYLSYFVEINNKKFHIGFDHRGTGIETEQMEPKELLYCIKSLIDLYKAIS